MAEENPFQALVNTKNPLMQLQHGWATPTPKSQAQRDFGASTGSQWADLGLGLLGRALVPPPSAKSFQRPAFIRPDLQRRLGGQFYAEAAGRRLPAPQLPGLLGALAQQGPQAQGIAEFISQARAAGRLPASPLSPYL